MTTRIVDRGWKKELTDALAVDSSHVRIVSPFIKVSAIKPLLDQKPSKLQVITRFNLAEWATGVSDVAALHKLINARAQIRGIKDLHAKLYVFGSSRAIITSANLTHAGFNHNFELGVVSDDIEFVRTCRDYFDNLWESAGDSVDIQQIREWTQRIEKCQLRGGRPDEIIGLGDYGAEIGLASPPRFDTVVNVGSGQQAFIKFLGRGSPEHREPLTTQIFKEIESSHCHYALAQSRRPRSVQDGDVIYIGRFTREPDDIRVFGKAFGKQHVPHRDDVTDADIRRIPWRKDYPHYTRVYGAEFVRGTLVNGVSRNELMDSLGSDSFLSTQQNAMQGHGNTDPRRSIRQHASVRLTTEAYEWLENHLQIAFETHGKISEQELATLYWP